MTRYTTLSIVTDPVPAASSLEIESIILTNQVDIAKIKVVPSDGTGTNVIEIYKTLDRQFNRLIYTSEEFTGVLYVDPVDSSGNELTQSFLFPYYDENESSTLHITIINNHSSAKTYTITIDYDSFLGTEIGILGSPDKLTAVAIPNGLSILGGVAAELFKDDCVEAEWRAKFVAASNYADVIDLRTVAEGGTFVPDGSTNLLVTKAATAQGAQFPWVSALQGRWYFVGRLRNGSGWSLWTDGNPTPKYVRQYVDTQTYSDDGPPAGWQVTLEPGPTANTVIVRASRPSSNGNNLLWWSVQVKDADSGLWRAIDANAGAAVTYYDGSEIAHSYADGYLSKATDGWGTAQPGSLVIVDVRGGNFNVNYCQWFLLSQGDIGTNTLRIGTGLRGGIIADLRIKIVSPPWEWSTEGYLGEEPNLGSWPGPGVESSANGGLGLGWIAGNFTTQEFVSTPIPIPEGVTNPEARVWFENLVARSDNDLTHSGNSTDGYGGAGAIMPTVFSDFGNRSYWVPIYPDPAFGSLNPSGSASMAIAGASQSLHPGACGMRSRFRIHGSLGYKINLKATFQNVILPVGISASDRLFLGIGLSNGVIGTYGDLWLGGLMVSGISEDLIKLGGGTYPRMSYAYNWAGSLLDPFAAGYAAYYNPTVERPPASTTFEVIFYWAKDSVTGNFAPINVQYRFGGSGDWITTTYGFTPNIGSCYFTGADIFLGFFSNCRLAASATLTSFEIIEGVGEVF